MEQLDSTQRKCLVCGDVIGYSKQDVKSGLIPVAPVCPRCITRKKQGKVETMTVETEQPFAEGKSYKKKWGKGIE